MVWSQDRPFTRTATPGKIPRVGILGLGASERTPMFDAFREGLQDLGYIEGRNIILEFGWPAAITPGSRS